MGDSFSSAFHMMYSAYNSCLMDMGSPFGGDENVLVLDRGGGCMALQVC